MEHQHTNSHPPFDDKIIDNLMAELSALDNETIDVDGVSLRPSQCYHFDIDPVHVLFNTNCPDTIRERVSSILSKYIPDESRSQ